MKLKNKYLYLSAAICCVMIFICWFFFGRELETGSVSYTLETEAADSIFSPVSSMKVYITGEVLNPGVYDIDSDMRVVDLIELAGGATDNADLTKINLAARIKDEQKVYVPPKDLESSGGSALININSATLEQLITLPGIGENTAKAIINRRETKGLFISIDELTEIHNIGEKTLERLRDLITAE